ncbi:Phosphatidylinositolglycan class N-domain-containing protein [Mycena haematopus]|nr:Phosphatidylinositolglycan class N-domain-containing protein [Mycena haematopus]
MASTQYNVSCLLLIGLIFHWYTLALVMFDCYFTSPVVHGMQSHGLGSAESKRLVLIVGDGLRADLLFHKNEVVAPYLRSIVETRGAFGVSHTRVPTESRPGHVAIMRHFSGGMYEDVSAVTKAGLVDFDSVFNKSSSTFSFGSPDILPMFSRGATPGKVMTWYATALDTWVYDQLATLLQTQPQMAHTTGHSYRPFSQEYMNNIQIVDDIYIFTADHGMSTIGNHGDGHPDNTRTPLVAWGRGIRGPLPDSSPSSHDSFSALGLNHLLRRDIEQADIAPLMAALVGIDWPVNSVGVLPDTIIEQYRVKHELKKAYTVLYQPFGLLEGTGSSNRFSKLDQIELALSRELSADLIKYGLEGSGMAIAAYTGWAAYASLFIFRPLHAYSARSPWTYYLYIAFPCYFWHQFMVQVLPLLQSQTRRVGYTRVLLYGGLIIVVLQSMVAAYVQRAIWSLGFVLIGTVWPFSSWTKESRSRLYTPYLWTVSCLVTGIFPLLSVDKTENVRTILAGGLCMTVAGAVFSRTIPDLRKPLCRLFVVQGILIALVMAVTSSSVYHLRAKLGLPLFNQVAGWIVLIVASILPFVSRVKHDSASSKMLMYFLAFGPCFVILSISVEGLFYVAYSITLASWIEVEKSLRSDLERVKKSKNVLQYRFQPNDIRIALFFLFFVQVGFFGTGKSFYLSPVYRLIPVFSPFAMALLLVFKIIAPYIILSVTFAALNDALHLPPFSLFLVALTLTDGMTLTFFFNVTDTGSWLEIGQTISFFCISSLLLLWSAGICAGGEYLMADVISEGKTPGDIEQGDSGLGNADFNSEVKTKSYAYEIKHLYELRQPLHISVLRQRYSISPPQRYAYTPKQLLDDVKLEDQEMLY